jgi:glucose/arabinose dehydrogenase
MVPASRAALAGASLAILVSGVILAIAEVRQVDDATPNSSRQATERECPTEPAVATARLTGTALRLREVGQAEAPTAAAFLPDRGHGVLGEREGRVLRVADGELTREVVLDLTDDTMQEGDGGLLALAYDAGGEWLYVYRADGAQDDVLTAYPVDEVGRPDAERGRVLLAVDHPESVQHHGGAMAIGADGLLYLGLGDGGGLGDPEENAQDPETLLGKVLRIAPTPGDDDPYRIPPDNPFVGQADAAPEIWLVGVRNPFRFGTDPQGGDLWLGDVGQSCWEELDRLTTGVDGAGGSNLGWDLLEGTHPFEGGEVPGRRLDPVVEHPHRDGWCGIVAGHVPRASAVPALDGHLLYSDYCSGDLMALPVDARDPSGGLIDTGLELDRPTAIVAGPDGHPWVLTLGGAVLAVEEG